MESNQPIKFKTFVMLFFQDQLQQLQSQKADLIDQQKFYKKAMEKLVPMKDNEVRKRMGDIPGLMDAYNDVLKIARGEEIDP